MILKYEFPKKIKKSKTEILILTSKSSLTYEGKKIDASVRSKVVVYNDFSDIRIICSTKPTEEENRRLGAQVFEKVKELKLSTVTFTGKFDRELVEGFILASYSFEGYKKEKKKFTLTVTFNSAYKTAVTEMKKICSSVFWSRDLVNQPFNYLGTEEVKTQIKDRFKGTKLKTTFWSKSKLIKENCGGILSVNKASSVDPTMAIIEHKPKNNQDEQPIVLVGKGIVYDTGGLSLKPTKGSMDIMKCDMGGLACMVGTMDALSKLVVNKWVICLLPITDNVIGNNAQAPGDVITMRSGLTVENMNTDAEGRLVMADALDYAKSYNPRLVIDAATLTGAAVHAIGHYASVMMGNANSKHFYKMNKHGDQTGERVTRFPFWDDYNEQLHSQIADLRNIGQSTGGAITAGKFLEHFVDYEWMHLDIAGPAYLDRKIDYKPQGGTGYGVRLLTSFIADC